MLPGNQYFVHFERLFQPLANYLHFFKPFQEKMKIVKICEQFRGVLDEICAFSARLNMYAWHDQKSFPQKFLVIIFRVTLQYIFYFQILGKM
ncbi:unnamed protein product [Ectocarpus sp. 8 AP-2014]